MQLLDVSSAIVTWTRTVLTRSNDSMTTAQTSTSTRTGVWMALASMSLIQVGVAASVGLFDQLGVAGTSWLRLTWAALILMAVGRPWRLRLTRSTWAVCTALGVATAGSTVLFLAAVDRLPLGTACALEFLGPLTVAVVHGRGLARLWVLPAGAGVALLTEPWQGGIDGLGVAAALGAAVCWGAYIVLTQRAGDQVAGVQALAISMPVAALVATVVAGPATLSHLTWTAVLVGLPLALLVPVVPFCLELLALRRINAAAFGTLMSLEPALAVVAGLLMLGQVPHLSALAGVACVVAAGVGAERSGARPASPAAVRALELASPTLAG